MNKVKEANFVSAVIYVHNEEKNIECFVKKIDKVLNDNFKKYEIICVNDASSDNSVDVIKKFGAEEGKSMISVLNMSYYQGLELAMNAGVDLTIGDFVFEFDEVDNNFSEDMIMNIYFESLKGYDIVSASSNAKQRFSSRMFYALFNKFSKTQFDLQTESFRVLSRRAINRVHALSKTIPYRKALYSNCGLNIKNLKYDCATGSKKQRMTNEQSKARKTLAVDALVLFTDIAYRFAMTMTCLMMITMAVFVIYAIGIYAYGTPIAGWTTTVLFFSFAFFGLFAILTIIIKYLSLLIDLVFRKQKYSFSSIEKITK